jgi:hypothetical protein
MLDDFKRALARVQSDYGFYVDCQMRPASALAGYDLSPDERSALVDPEKLAEVLKIGIGISEFRIPRFTITISGTHDWVNRAPSKRKVEDADHNAMVALEVEAIERASTDGERTEAAVRLMELIG